MATLISHSPAETEALERKSLSRAARLRMGHRPAPAIWARARTQFCVKGSWRAGSAFPRACIRPHLRSWPNTAADASSCFIWICTASKLRQQILSAGVEEFLQPDGVAVIEWAVERMPEVRPGDADWKWVRIETLNETDRKIIYDDFGA